MTDKHRSDDELVEADRRAYRARFIWGPIFTLYGFLAAVGSVYAIHIGLLPKAWMDGHQPLVIMGVVLILALPAIVFLARRYRIPKAARMARVQRKLADDHHRRLRIANATCAIIVPLTAAMVIAMDIYHGGQFAVPGDLFLPFEFAFIALIGLFGVLRGPAEGDEWTRALRATATRIGFIVAIIGFCGVYLLAFLRPEWTRLAIPVVIALTLMSASITFLIADWRAGRED
jgi:hypothetical protein